MTVISSLMSQRVSRIMAAIILLMAICAAGISPEEARAEENKDQIYNIGLRAGNLFEVKHAPVNSMPMVSFYVRREVNDSWGAVLSLDSYVFDIKNTGGILGIPTEKESKASGEMSMITASVDHVFFKDVSCFQPYVQAGLGLGFVDFDDKDNVSSAGGAPYNIKTEAKDDMEVVPTLSIGTRYMTGSRWFLDAGARFDYHVSGWKIKDRVSGGSVSIDNFYALGAYLGFGVKL